MVNTIYAQTINLIVNLIGNEEVGLPLSDEFLNMNPNILNIDITDIEPKPNINDKYDIETNTFIPYEEWFFDQSQELVQPTLSEIETATAMEKQADVLISNMELAEKLNKLLGIEESDEINQISPIMQIFSVDSPELELPTPEIPTQIQINYFNMIQNFFNRRTMNTESVAKFVKIGNLTPEQYQMITGREYIE